MDFPYFRYLGVATSRRPYDLPSPVPHLGRPANMYVYAKRNKMSSNIGELRSQAEQSLKTGRNMEEGDESCSTKSRLPDRGPRLEEQK